VKTETVVLKELKPHPKNPNRHPKNQLEELEKSLDSFGQFKNIVIWNGYILAGHGLVEAGLTRGLETLEAVDVSHLSEQQALALIVADNRLPELAEMDDESLAKILNSIDEPLGVAGIDEEYLDEILGESIASGLTDEDKIPEAKESVVESGQLWKLGKHRLLCGDAVKDKDAEALMGGEVAEMSFTDPPYNVSIGTIKHPKFIQREIQNDSMTSDEYLAFCFSFIGTIKANTRGCIYVCGAQHKDGRILFTELDNALHSSTTIVWIKDRFTLGRSKYQNQYEPIWFGWNECGGGFSEKRNLVNVWNYDRPQSSKLHPTMKPVELVVNAITHASSGGDIVLDLFLGSGSTLIACEKTNRKCYGMEIDPHYCDVIIKRWEDFTGKKAELIISEDEK